MRSILRFVGAEVLEGTHPTCVRVRHRTTFIRFVTSYGVFPTRPPGILPSLWSEEVSDSDVLGTRTLLNLRRRELTKDRGTSTLTDVNGSLPPCQVGLGGKVVLGVTDGSDPRGETKSVVWF